MWIDDKTPGCLYDTTDCTGNCCERGKLMFERYLKENEEELTEEEINEYAETWMANMEKRVYGNRCKICNNTPCSCDEPVDTMKWWRKNIAEEMTRKELEDRVVEYHEEIHRLRNELTKLNEK